MPTLKITGVDEGAAQFVVERAKELHFKGQAEYLRNLIREDMAKASGERTARLTSILAPLHEHSTQQGYTDEFLAEVFERARDAVASSRKSDKDSIKKSP